MSRSNPTVLFGFFVAIIVAMCGAALLKGGLFIGKHEGDTFHVLQIVFRMADGQWPHLDFMTPIGALAFAPIALFMRLGYGVGSAFLMAQALVAVVLLPAIWWAAYSRMRGIFPYLFGLIVLVLITALVHGEAQRSVSISMHYNRWAWAGAFVVISLSILPNIGRARPIVDGLIIGLVMAALLMLKVTYFAAFFIPVALAMVLRKNHQAIVVAGIIGLVVALLITVIAGPAYWLAYLGDLLAVAASEIRSQPSDAFGAVVGAPAYIAGSLTLMAAVVFLRQSGEEIGGLILLLLVPGFFYVTFQNFANDPQWLLLLGVLLFCFQTPEGQVNGFGWDMGKSLQMLGVVAFALTAPSFLNLAYSPYRHYYTDTTQYAPMLPRSGHHTDLQASVLRSVRVSSKVTLDGPDTPFAAFWDVGKHTEDTEFLGETLPRCQLALGITTWFQTIVDDLEQAGLAKGKRLFAADLFSSHWLFGSLEPLKNGAPWYYGGLPGFDSADYLLVPMCPMLQVVRRLILKDIEDSGVELTEVRRTELYILYAKTAGDGS